MVLVSEAGVRHGTQFYHTNDGYYYHKYREHGHSVYFRCIDRNCFARGVLRLRFEQTYQHNHQPDFLYLHYLRERNAVVSEASSMTAVSLREAFLRSNNGAFEASLNYESLRSTLRRTRLRTYPEEPSTLSSLDDILRNPASRSLCAVTNSDESLYQGSITCEGSTIILLMTNRCAQILKWVPCLHTFSVSVPITGSDVPCQVHVIGSTLGKTAVPLAILLLERNTLQSFVTGLSYLRNHLQTWSFRTVIARDHGVEANAYGHVFGVKVEFPLSQYLYDIGHLSKHILLNGHDADDILNLFCGLPMVPLDLLSLSLEVIREKIEVKDELTQHTMSLLLVNIQLRWLNSPLRESSFSMCGNSNRTSDFIEVTEARIIRRLIRDSGIGLYGVLGHIKQIEEIAFNDIGTLAKGRQPSISRRMSSLSQDPQIVALTMMLTHPGVEMSSQLSNLMFVAGTRKRHIFTRAMQEQFSD